MREQVPERRAGRACGLVELDRPLLDRDEQREAGEQLRHRGPAQLPPARPVRRDDAPGAGDAGGGDAGSPPVDRAQRLHAAILGAVDRRAIGSGSDWERRGGYSRAVVAGGRVFVAGTAPIMPGDADPPADPYGQAHRCLEIVAAALEEAGGGLGDVVRTRLLMTDASYAPEILRAHGEAFGGVRPACTGIVVGLLDPRWLVEIEVDAVLPTSAPSP